MIDLTTSAIIFAEADPEPYHIEMDDGLLVVSDAEIDRIRAYRIPEMTVVATVPTQARGHQMVVLIN